MAGFSTKNKANSTTLSEINVTPMVDVMLVLLIIFMVSAPLMQQGIEVNLPKVQAEAIQQSDSPIVLSISKNGQIEWDGKATSFSALRQKLQNSRAQKTDVQILVQADEAVNYGVVAKVMGEVKLAKIKRVGLVTAPADGDQ